MPCLPLAAAMPRQAPRGGLCMRATSPTFWWCPQHNAHRLTLPTSMQIGPPFLPYLLSGLRIHNLGHDA